MKETPGKKKRPKSSKEEEPVHESTAPPGRDNNVDTPLCTIEKTEKEKKTKKKSKKKAKSKGRVPYDGDNDARVDPSGFDDAPPPATINRLDDAAEDRHRADRATRKAEKLELKTRLKSQIPTTDPNGVPYGKMQMRRMMRRVKHGLSPIPTEQEEREMRAREAQERREEEALYAASTGTGDDAGDDDEGKNDEENENPSGGGVGGDVEGTGAEGRAPRPRPKRARRSKPVPPDYVCRACMNGLPDFSPHWIYDCPMKETRRGCNAVAKRLRGLHDPPSRKVFVSGLPFNCTEVDVKRFFEGGTREEGGEGDAGGTTAELVHCKLLKFEDSHRCKGQAFLTFSSDDGANLALKLDGSVWREVEEPGAKGKKGKGAKKKTMKELKVRVTRVLNRQVTKQKAGMQ